MPKKWDAGRIASASISVANRLLFFLLFLIAAALVGIVLLDRYAADSFLSGQVIRLFLEGRFASPLFSPSHWLSRYNLSGIYGFVLTSLGFLLLKLLLDGAVQRAATTNGRRVIASFLNLGVNCILLVLALLLFFNAIVASYIDEAFSSLSPGTSLDGRFSDRAALVVKRQRASIAKARSALDQLADELAHGMILPQQLSDQDYIALAQKVSALAQKSQGAGSQKEHYLRNCFDRAPATLDEMADTILHRPSDPFGWKLLPPEESLLHMFGKDGEYHLKFASSDGLFEAVYDKEGELLTAQNDPVNMGTFNYADPATAPEKHLAFDMWPYFAWGNTGDSPRLYEPRMEAELDVVGDRYLNNKDAQQRYERYRLLFERGGSGS